MGKCLCTKPDDKHQWANGSCAIFQGSVEWINKVCVRCRATGKRFAGNPHVVEDFHRRRKRVLREHTQKETGKERC